MLLLLVLITIITILIRTIIITTITPGRGTAAALLRVGPRGLHAGAGDSIIHDDF